MELLIKTQKAKEKFAENHGHNNLRLFDALANFCFSVNFEYCFRNFFCVTCLGHFLSIICGSVVQLSGG